ncbi:hypothetical protein TC41_2740 [Alicyclobacillus acidocaldarius subsp. acidocaldarius Tc-4-1]|uniref:Uncharacterized protein n=1 Tax=Alicyclobacillus acidocaldarius (strain Tc-4-1) TaxID=1048834 RepID=F8IIV9_ALIAT|nr:hypothetical protein TC41_2740 [Alicyclobacillus acidocaldarius subsp. acidocaldarius Tc-4-1]
MYGARIESMRVKAAAAPEQKSREISKFDEILSARLVC